jgi:signal peptidase
MLREYVVRALLAAFVVVTLALVLGSLLGQPVLLSFVTSGSMAPTIDEGDGFVAVPDQVAGDIEEGDVVVFRAEELNGGGLTTHRVVDKTEEGYITRGDANAFTDQDSGEPPVTEDQIVGVAVQVNGDVITIPGLGTAATGLREGLLAVQSAVTSTLGFDAESGAEGVGTVLFLAGLALLAVTAVDAVSGKSRERRRSRRRGQFDPRYVALFLVAIVVLPANAAMLAPTTTHQVTFDGNEIRGSAQPGEPVESEVTATNNGLVTMLVTFDQPDRAARLADRQLALTGGSEQTTSLSAPAPPPGEQRTVAVSEHRYVLILPQSVILALHGIHPLVALAAINAVLVFSVLALVAGLVGLRRRRVRSTGRDVPIRVRIGRLFR